MVKAALAICTLNACYITESHKLPKMTKDGARNVINGIIFKKKLHFAVSLNNSISFVFNASTYGDIDWVSIGLGGDFSPAGSPFGVGINGSAALAFLWGFIPYPSLVFSIGGGISVGTNTDSSLSGSVFLDIAFPMD